MVGSSSPAGLLEMSLQIIEMSLKVVLKRAFKEKMKEKIRSSLVVFKNLLQGSYSQVPSLLIFKLLNVLCRFQAQHS